MSHRTITRLIRNTDGSYVQYPCLRALKLGGSRRLDVPRLPVFPGAVPFPNLQHLDMRSVYPFGDDTAFRGNAATLESLALISSPDSVRVLQQYRVFTPASHPKLQHVRLGVDFSSEPELFETDIDYMRFLLSIGPNAPVRTVLYSYTDLAFQSVIPVFGEYACIQILTLESVHMSLWDAFAMIKALPLLSDMYAPFPVLGPRPDGVPNHKLPAYVLANFSPIGERFRCWNSMSYISGSVKSAVRCALLLALVCPNFDYVATHLVSRYLFMAHMKKMITTDGFRPHASRLRRLLFGGSTDEIPNVKMIHGMHDALRASRSREDNEFDL
ncbi:hypothetical protein FBU31_005607 [Coemansia sp. 'formosensis']|nr:hypothetical protein FBU31_005607 [Coemansia sp. 'formosensis']